MRLAVWTTWVFPLLFWIGFFLLFWSMRRWNWSKFRMLAIALVCAVIASLALLAVVYVIVTVFD